MHTVDVMNRALAHQMVRDSHCRNSIDQMLLGLQEIRSPAEAWRGSGDQNWRLASVHRYFVDSTEFTFSSRMDIAQEGNQITVSPQVDCLHFGAVNPGSYNELVQSAPYMQSQSTGRILSRFHYGFKVNQDRSISDRYAGNIVRAADGSRDGRNIPLFAGEERRYFRGADGSLFVVSYDFSKPISFHVYAKVYRPVPASLAIVPHGEPVAAPSVQNGSSAGESLASVPPAPTAAPSVTVAPAALVPPAACQSPIARLVQSATMIERPQTVLRGRGTWDLDSMHYYYADRNGFALGTHVDILTTNRPTSGPVTVGLAANVDCMNLGSVWPDPAAVRMTGTFRISRRTGRASEVFSNRYAVNAQRIAILDESNSNLVRSQNIEVGLHDMTLGDSGFQRVYYHIGRNQLLVVEREVRSGDEIIERAAVYNQNR